MADAVGSELPFAAICTSDRSANLADLRRKCSDVWFGEPFNKRCRLCQNYWVLIKTLKAPNLWPLSLS